MSAGPAGPAEEQALRLPPALSMLPRPEALSVEAHRLLCDPVGELDDSFTPRHIVALDSLEICISWLT